MLAAVQPAVAAASEPLSFDAFYRREHRHVLGLAFVLTGNQAVAEDIAQMRSRRHFGTGVPSRPTTRRAAGFDG